MKFSTAPLVSVVIPVYNQGEYIEASVSSVLAQDYPSRELIVVDDGSTDATGERLARMRDIAVISQANQGAAAALNRGLEASSGELVCWLSADDEYLPGKLSRQVRDFVADPSLAMSYMGFETMDAAGRTIGLFPTAGLHHRDPFVGIFQANTINGSTVMMRRSVWQASGRFDEGLRADVDGDMWLRIARHHQILGIDGIWLRYRVHDKALSANTKLMHDSMSVVRRRYLRDGVLEERVLRADGSGAGDTFAAIASSMSRLGLISVAQEVLDLAKKHHAPRAAVLASQIGLARRELFMNHPTLRRRVDRLRFDRLLRH